MREETRVPRAFVLVESRVTWPLIQERILIIIGTKNNDLILFNWALFCRLFIINLAVLYNLIFVIGRAIFWQLQNLLPLGWYVLDYTSDFIYILDIIIRYLSRNHFQTYLKLLVRARSWLYNLMGHYIFILCACNSLKGTRRLPWPGNHGEGLKTVEVSLHQDPANEGRHPQHIPDRPPLPGVWQQLSWGNIRRRFRVGYSNL